MKPNYWVFLNSILLYKINVLYNLNQTSDAAFINKVFVQNRKNKVGSNAICLCKFCNIVLHNFLFILLIFLDNILFRVKVKETRIDKCFHYARFVMHFFVVGIEFDVCKDSLYICLCFLLVIEGQIPRLVLRVFFLVCKEIEVSLIELAESLHRSQSFCKHSENYDKFLLLILFDKISTISRIRANLTNSSCLLAILGHIVFVAFNQIFIRISAFKEKPPKILL